MPSVSHGHAVFTGGLRGRAGGAIRYAAAWVASPICGIDGMRCRLTWIALFTAVLLFNAFDPSRAAGTRCLADRVVRTASYELYLFHIIVLGAIRDLTKESLPTVYKLPCWWCLSRSPPWWHSCRAGFADPLNGYLRRRLSLR